MMIEVVNKHNFSGQGEYIGRPSTLGNPYTGNRTQIIAKYKIWLWKEVKQKGGVYKELLRLKTIAESGDLYLICWCKPKPCHGDVVKACLEWMIGGDIG